MIRLLIAAVIASGFAFATASGFMGFDIFGRSSEKGQDMTEVKTDLETLERLVTLPVTPTSARFSTQTMPGGGDWVLTASLRLSAQARDSLLEGRAPTTELINLQVPDWADASDRPAQDAPLYVAEAFFKSPLLNGYMAPVGEDGLYLVMFTQ